MIDTDARITDPALAWTAQDWQLFDCLDGKSLRHIAYAMNKPLVEVEAACRERDRLASAIAAPAPRPVPQATMRANAPQFGARKKRGGLPAPPVPTRPPSRPAVREGIHAAFAPYIGHWNSEATGRPLPD